ncbi:maleylpyruvate isomerase N-terminal domain-containing protein [Actinomadura sp. ATCC 39365]|uniref:maleylpyruvate isomerase N-terminal domain-containing protein n=1 Tax=Nonomuraea sp. NPDC005692 TaxID=3157168 RepID=UPI0033F16B60
MDHVAHFHREVRAFEAAARRATSAGGAPLVPSCPGWSVADLVIHLGAVHRHVHAVIDDRLPGLPDPADVAVLGLPADFGDWPHPDRAPNTGPVPPAVLDWFAEGAARLGARFSAASPDDPAWTWSAAQTVGFWQRMQAIEAAVHRWDAENALGPAAPIDAAFAADAVTQVFEVMAPARRSWTQAPPGEGERYLFRQSDGPGRWAVCFDGDDVRLTGDSKGAVELAGTASDLLLHLWHRLPADRLDVRGDRALLDRYFTLVPPV